MSGPGRIAPGATAYVRGPKGIWIGSAGVADIEHGTLVPVDARMRLESVSKIRTATLVLQLAQEGRARLTRLTARVAADPSTEFPSAVWIELAASQPLLFPPGSAYHYSNIGFEVLGLVASRVSGESVRRLYRERIFEPLRLEHSAYDPQGPIAGPHALGYALSANRHAEDATDSHGGVAADAEDTATFLDALMHGKLLGPSMLAAMKRDVFWSGGEPTGCGGVAYGHSGGGSGFKTNVWVSGDGSRVAVLLLNGRSGDDGDVRAGAAMHELYCKG